MEGTKAASFEIIYDYVERESLQKYLRLTIIVCLYIFIRKYYSNWAKQRHITRQLAIDKKEKELEEERSQKKEEETFSKLDREANAFGWGKATRRDVKRKEKILEDTANELRERHQGHYDAAEDHDIEHLLQD